MGEVMASQLDTCLTTDPGFKARNSQHQHWDKRERIES